MRYCTVKLHEEIPIIVTLRPAYSIYVATTSSHRLYINQICVWNPFKRKMKEMTMAAAIN